MRVICPMCLTDRYMKYISGTHAGGGGNSYHYEELECHQCKSTICAKYECDEKTNELLEMNIHYKKGIKEGSGTYA